MRISDWSSDVCSSDLEVRRIDQIAAIARQRDAVPGFQISRARLGVLTRKTTDAHDALAHAVHEYQGHLQQHLEALGDHIRAAIRKRFRAVTAMQHEPLAHLRARDLRLEVVDFSSEEHTSELQSLMRT